MEDYKQMYEDILKEFNQYKLESIKWSIENFTTLEVDGEEITEENAQDALENMIHDHDCSNGINWDDIYYYFHIYSDKVPEGEEQWRKNLIREQHSNS